jgi:hypothetical protein
MKELLERLAKIAMNEVGVLETGGNNQGPRIKEYQKATLLYPGEWPWCAAFVCWCIREWLLKVPGTQDAVGIEDNDTAMWRPMTARAFSFIEWAQKRGLYVTDEKELAQTGDIAVFDFSHVGIVVADQKAGEKFIQTVEGNTNGKGERDSLSGDGVWKKKRDARLVRAYIRIIPKPIAA